MRREDPLFGPLRTLLPLLLLRSTEPARLAHGHSPSHKPTIATTCPLIHLSRLTPGVPPHPSPTTRTCRCNSSNSHQLCPWLLALIPRTTFWYLPIWTDLIVWCSHGHLVATLPCFLSPDLIVVSCSWNYDGLTSSASSLTLQSFWMGMKGILHLSCLSSLTRGSW